MNSLEILFPEGKAITLNKKDYTIHRIKVQHLAFVTDEAVKIFSQFQKKDITQLVLENINTILDILPKITQITKKELNELDIDELIKLVACVLEVNVDFFIKRVLPAIREMALINWANPAEIQSVTGST